MASYIFAAILGAFICISLQGLSLVVLVGVELRRAGYWRP
jgi:hypothetical protein